MMEIYKDSTGIRLSFEEFKAIVEHKLVDVLIYLIDLLNVDVEIEESDLSLEDKVYDLLSSCLQPHKEEAEDDDEQDTD